MCAMLNTKTEVNSSNKNTKSSFVYTSAAAGDKPLFIQQTMTNTNKKRQDKNVKDSSAKQIYVPPFKAI